LRHLLDSTVDELHRLRATGVDLDASDGGILQVCSSSGGLKGLRHEAEEWGRWGVRTEEVTATELRAAEPMLTGSLAGAVRLVDDGRFDPALLLAAVIAEGDRHGVETVTGRVARIEPRGDSARVHTSSGVLDAGRVVVAAGVWTPALCKPLGVRLPIVPARGNSITLPNAPRPNSPMLLVEQRMALSPLAQGLRLTGGFRLTHPSDREINPKRSRELVERASQVLDLPSDTVPDNEWTGLRPATTDGLPIVGALAGARSVLIAAGHGMLGSTTGLGTGEVVAALLAGEEMQFDAATVSPDRFARRGSGR
jgi:D-amino-acid dehydrogenase